MPFGEPDAPLERGAAEELAGGRKRPWRSRQCLRCLDAYSEEQNIARTIDLICYMDEPMDEALLSSVVEACVRIRKPEFLAAKLGQLKNLLASATQRHTGGHGAGRRA